MSVSKATISKSWITEQLAIFFASSVIFFVVSYPFTLFTSYFVISEVRLSAVLNPCLGFVFGPSAALGCAAGNFVCDCITVDAGTAWGGLILQILYGLIPWSLLQWYRLEKEEKEYYRFTNVKRVLLFYLAIVVDCLFMGTCLAIFFASGSGRIEMFKFILANNLTFNFVFSIPLVMLLVHIKRKKRGRVRTQETSIGEIILVFLMLVECVTIFLVCTVSFFQMKDYLHDVALWDQVFLSGVFVAALFVVLQVLFMLIIEKRILVPLNVLAGVWKKDRKLAVETCNALYHDKTEIGNLSRAYLELVDEIQVSIMKLSREKVVNNGVSDVSIYGDCAKMIFAGSLEETDVQTLVANLAQIPASCNYLEIDVQNMTFMTGEILRTLSEFIEKREGFGIGMKHASESTKMILNITGFNDLIEVLA